MSFWGDAWDVIRGAAVSAGNAVATAGAVAGAAAGASPSPAPGPKMRNPTPANPSPGQAALNQLQQGPAVAPGEAIKQSAQAVIGAGPLADAYKTPVVWAIIIVIGIVGVWGLIAPGGGVALIERRVRGR